jgi:kinesin family member 5
MVKDALSAQAAKFDAERLQMTNFLQSKIEKNLQLEM